MSGYVVELSSGCWLDGTRGSPGHTMSQPLAKVYTTDAGARRALTRARRYEDFPRARVVPYVALDLRGLPLAGGRFWYRCTQYRKWVKVVHALPQGDRAGYWRMYLGNGRRSNATTRTIAQMRDHAAKYDGVWAPWSDTPPEDTPPEETP